MPFLLILTLRLHAVTVMVVVRLGTALAFSFDLPRDELQPEREELRHFLPGEAFHAALGVVGVAEGAGGAQPLGQVL